MERLIEVQKRSFNARRDISAAFHGGASSSRTLNKIAAVLYHLSYEDPYFSSKPNIDWYLRKKNFLFYVFCLHSSEKIVSSVTT